MRILHITATHLNPLGGVPVVLKNLIEYQNKIVNVQSRLISLRAQVNSTNCQYFDYCNVKDFKSYLKKYKPNIAIIHSFFYFEYNLIYLDLIKLNIPYYIEPHGSFGKKALSRHRIKKTIANLTIFRKLIKKAKGFIYLCDEERINSKFRTDNDIIIPNGVSKIEYNKIYNDKIRIYYMGRYEKHHKGLDYLFKALKYLDNKGIELYLDFFGAGSEKQIKNLNMAIKDLKNVKCINKGPIFNEDKEKYLIKYSINILTSRYEGFPMTILEAWQLGIPCIVTKGTNVSKIVKENQLGWVTGYKKSDIANAIIQALSEYQEKGDVYIKKCIDYVNQEYNWLKIAQKSIVELEKNL